MRYRLKFINSREEIVRELDIEASDDASAIQYSCRQSVQLDMAVELCDGARTVIRVTPMTARLHLLDDGAGPSA
jgi:hypothetical protein